MRNRGQAVGLTLGVVIALYGISCFQPFSTVGAQARPPVAPRPPAYPQRPLAPKEVLDRGLAAYGIHCSFCHGSDAAGGETGPNLLRSGVVLDDEHGENIAPIVHGARIDRGMPRIDITDSQIADIAAWLHSLRVSSRSGPPPVPINIVTGDMSRGRKAFGDRCASCHTGEMSMDGIASRITDPRSLQQTWLLPGSATRRGFGSQTQQDPKVNVPPVMVSVENGKESVTGDLLGISDFYVSLRLPDGTYQSFARDGDTPKVTLHDPLKPHRDLLKTYHDREIHDITAYLVTLK